jgi:hypothetical protein
LAREGAPTEVNGEKGGFTPVGLMEWWNIQFKFNPIVERLYVFDYYSSIPIFHDLEVNILRRQRKKKKRCMPAIQEEGDLLCLTRGV